MKERLIKVLKWFFIILGVLFLIQLLIVSGIVIGFKAVSDFDIPKTEINHKDFQNIIDYAQNYRKENGKFPDNIDNVKLKKGLDYNYKTTNEGNCFDVTIKSKNTLKQYQNCSASSDNTNSFSESFSEFKN